MLREYGSFKDAVEKRWCAQLERDEEHDRYGRNTTHPHVWYSSLGWEQGVLGCRWMTVVTK
jgi:hypothetical protein